MNFNQEKMNSTINNLTKKDSQSNIVDLVIPKQPPQIVERREQLTTEKRNLANSLFYKNLHMKYKNLINSNVLESIVYNIINERNQGLESYSIQIENAILLYLLNIYKQTKRPLQKKGLLDRIKIIFRGEIKKQYPNISSQKIDLAIEETFISYTGERSFEEELAIKMNSTINNLVKKDSPSEISKQPQMTERKEQLTTEKRNLANTLFYKDFYMKYKSLIDSDVLDLIISSIVDRENQNLEAYAIQIENAILLYLLNIYKQTKRPLQKKGLLDRIKIIFRGEIKKLYPNISSQKIDLAIEETFIAYTGEIDFQDEVSKRIKSFISKK